MSLIVARPHKLLTAHCNMVRNHYVRTSLECGLPLKKHLFKNYFTKENQTPKLTCLLPPLLVQIKIKTIRQISHFISQILHSKLNTTSSASIVK